MKQQCKKKGLSGTTLKWIALVSMLLDHIGVILLERGLLPKIAASVLGGHSVAYLPSDYSLWSNIAELLRLCGRISFPIFCFLLVEGFLHTKSAVHYALRLGLFALISEIPFDFAVYHRIYSFQMQNVFFTLLLGLLTLIAITRAQLWLRSFAPRLVFLSFLVLPVGMALAHLLRTDYSAFGVLFISLLYFLRNSRTEQCIFGVLGTLWGHTAPLAFLPIYFYNGERGKHSLQYFFYLFYPAHLLVLALLNTILQTVT